MYEYFKQQVRQVQHSRDEEYLMSNPFFKKIQRVHLVQARKSDALALTQLLIQFNLVNPATNEKETQFNLFERRYRDKQSYLEWRMAYMFTEGDLKEGLNYLL